MTHLHRLLLEQELLHISYVEQSYQAVLITSYGLKVAMTGYGKTINDAVADLDAKLKDLTTDAIRG